MSHLKETYLYGVIKIRKWSTMFKCKIGPKSIIFLSTILINLCLEVSKNEENPLMNHTLTTNINLLINRNIIFFNIRFKKRQKVMVVVTYLVYK